MTYIVFDHGELDRVLSHRYDEAERTTLYQMWAVDGVHVVPDESPEATDGSEVMELPNGMILMSAQTLLDLIEAATSRGMRTGAEMMSKVGPGVADPDGTYKEQPPKPRFLGNDDLPDPM